MKIRYRLIRRGERGKQFYCVDSETGQRFSLRTKDRDTAEQIVLAKNQSLRQPSLNLQIAKAYLAGTDSGVATRTWQDAIDAIVETKHGSTKEHWSRAGKDKALDGIRNQIIIATQGEHLLQALIRLTLTNSGAQQDRRTMSELCSMQDVQAPSPSAPDMFGVGEPTRVAHSPQKMFGPLLRP